VVVCPTGFVPTIRFRFRTWHLQPQFLLFPRRVSIWADRLRLFVGSRYPKPVEGHSLNGANLTLI
jgi:hypothetical protein